MSITKRQKLTEKGIRKEKYKATEESDMERWVDLCREIGTMERPFSFMKNSIVVVGTGVQCISHFTLEALTEIKLADDVFYCVADHVTGLFIKKLRSDAFDLHVLYSDDKSRVATFIQMTEACLHQTRKGRNVCLILSGHPAMFNFTCHRLVKIARSEEIPTKILPSISKEDCLFSDLQIDPCFPGLQTLEATDFLLHNRRIDTTLHVVFYMVGAIGSVDGEYDINNSANNFKVLVRMLQKICGQNYEVVHYIPSQFPVCKPVVQSIGLNSLLTDITVIRLSATSMLYIPPVSVDKQDKSDIVDSSDTLNAKYESIEQNFIKDLANWSVPESYVKIVDSELSEVLIDLSLNPSFVKLCEDEEFPRLKNSKQRRALYRRKPEEIRKTLHPETHEDATDEPEIRYRKPVVRSLKKNFLPKTVKPIIRICDGNSD